MEQVEISITNHLAHRCPIWHMPRISITALFIVGLIFTTPNTHADDFKIGVRAKSGVEYALAQWQPTADYLTKQIPEHSFTLVPIVSLNRLTEVAGKGELDFVLTNPTSYIEMEMLYGARRLLTLNNKLKGSASSHFGSVIFTRSDRDDIKTLQDLKGKTLMAVSEQAFGGWRVAWSELRKNGIEPEQDLAALRFGNSLQPNVVFNVRNGIVDVGVVRTDQLERMAARGEINMDAFKVIGEKQTDGFPFHHSTSLYPEWPFVSLKNISNEVAKKVAMALLLISPNDPAAIKGEYTGWTVPLNYQPVHELMKELRIGPHKDVGKVTLSETVRHYSPWIMVIALAILGLITTLTSKVKSNYRLAAARSKLEQSKSMMYSVLDTIPARVYWKDTEGNYLGCNRLFALDAGFESPNQIIGKNDYDMTWAKQAKTYRAQDRRVAHTGKPEINREEERQGPGGSKLFLEKSKIPLMDKSGEAVGVLGAYQLINERKEAEKELRDSEIHYRHLVESANAIPWVFDWSLNRFTYVGHQAEALLGYPIESWYEENFWANHLHPDDHKMATEYCKEQTEKGVKHSFEYRMIAADNSIIWVRDSAQTFKQSTQVIVRGFMFDITESKQSEEDLRLLATAFESQHAVTITDKYTNILCANQAFCNITGYSLEEVIGKKPSILSSGVQDAQFYQKLWDSLNETGAWEGEIWNKRKNGEIYPELLGITSVKDNSGETTHYVASFLDISESKHQQNVINQNAAEDNILKSLLNLSLQSQPIDEYLLAAIKLVTTSDSVPNLQSKGAVFLNTMQGTGEALKLTASYNLDDDILTMCAEVPFGECLCGRAAEHRIIQFEDCRTHKHNHTISFNSKLTKNSCSIPILQNEKVLGVITLFFSDQHTHKEDPFLNRIADVLSMGIAKKYAEDSMVRAKNSADKANQAKSEFLSRMSHELRTPMNAILGYSELLSECFGEDILTPNQLDEINQIHKAGVHLLALINEVLDLARIEAGRIDLSMENIQCQQIINECMMLIEPLAMQHEISLDFDDQPFKDIILYTDSTRLKEVLLNLLSNAVKYNSNQGNITLSGEIFNKNWLRITVTDTGPGITEEQMHHLFQPFERLGAEHGDIEGTGIGLVIVKRIVELMGGRIGAESTIGVGSTFWIELEIQNNRDKSTQEIDASDVETVPGNIPCNSSGSVLYIEDNLSNLRLVEHIFNKDDSIKFLSALTPEHGLELALKHKPDVILLDINLPKMDGYEVFDRLKETEETRNIPIIAVTAQAMPMDIERGVKAGFTAYITKPINVNELRMHVNEALRITPAEVKMMH